MDIKEFNPYVRFCSAVWLNSDYQKSAKAYDYRLFYVISGGFTAHFENERVEVNEGSVLIFPPGVAYRLAPHKFGKSNHIIVNFDFVSDNIGTPTRMAFEPNAFYDNEIYSMECVEPFSNIFYMKNAFFCSDILLRMCEERKVERGMMDAVLSGMMKVLLSIIAREVQHRADAPHDAAGLLCEKIKEYIKTEITNTIDNASIAKKFGYHPYYINSVFKKKTGKTLHKYIIDARLDLAKEMLLASDMSIAQIGENCGFSGASYFCECFSSQFGMTPKQFREKAK